MGRNETKEKLRRPLTLATLIAGLILTAGLVGLTWWPVVNSVESGLSSEYPEIQPAILPFPVHLVRARALEAIEARSDWELIEAGAEVVSYRARGPGLTPDAQVTARLEGREGTTVVWVRSENLEGAGDFGQNARNISAFLNALDSALEFAEPQTTRAP
ncbi:MAG: DUF1499 domain-containing protein [Myxococcales bacterium]|nr:DUF1499 domain-containing protein [Myxococcales bacterium]